MVENELDFVLILDEEQYQQTMHTFEAVADSLIVDEMGKYSLGAFDDGMKAVWFAALAIDRTQLEVMRFILQMAHYVCCRFQDSPYIFTRNIGDMIDLYEDYYRHTGVGSMEKDLMTPEERYMVIACDPGNPFKAMNSTFLYSEEGAEDDVMIIPLTPMAPELYMQEDEVNIMDEDIGGEVYTVDLAEILPHSYFKIVALKLDNPLQNIL